MRKKREFHSSELVKSLAKIYGFDEILVSFKIKDFLREYLDESLFNEIEQVRLNKGVLTLKIKSPLLKNDYFLGFGRTAAIHAASLLVRFLADFLK